jgi:hypothetical protein
MEYVGGPLDGLRTGRHVLTPEYITESFPDDAPAFPLYTYRLRAADPDGRLRYDYEGEL